MAIYGKILSRLPTNFENQGTSLNILLVCIHIIRYIYNNEPLAFQKNILLLLCTISIISLLEKDLQPYRFFSSKICIET